MNTGFQVINDSGSIIVDEKYSNLTMRSKGTNIVVQDLSYIEWHGSTSTLTVTAETPVLAIASSFFTAIRSVTNNNNGTWTFILMHGADSGTYDWYLFDKAHYVGDSNCGLQIFDAAGQKTFDSGTCYANVIDVVAFSRTVPVPYISAPGASATSYFTNNYTAGKVYAVVQGLQAYNLAFYPYQQMGTRVHWAYGGARTGPGFVEFGGFTPVVQAIPTTSPDQFLTPPNSDTYSALVLDVTNF